VSRRGLIVLAFTLVACSPRVDLTPPLGPGTRAVIMIVETPDGRLLEAIDRDQAPVRTLDIGNQGDLEIWSLAYAVPLQDLNLRAGPLAIDGAGSPLPVPRAIHHTRVGGSDASAWQEDTELPERLRELRVADISVESCLEGGGCMFRRVPEVLSCVSPCPRPVEPLPPAPPQPPRLDQCLDGWSVSQKDGLRVCEPGPTAPIDCPSGEGLWPGRSACTPLGHLCQGRYSSALPVGTPIRYVDPEAPAGGDGSLAAPYQRLVTALSAAPAGAVLALAQARFDERLVMTADRRVIGACPGGTILAPPLRDGLPTVQITGGRVELEDLTIEVDGFGVLINGGAASLRGIELVGQTSGTGISASGARLDLFQVRIHDVFFGVLVEGGDSTHLQAVSLEDVAGEGVLVGQVPSLVTDDLRIDQAFGTAIAVRGSSWQGRGIWARGVSNGIYVAESTTASVSDVVLTDLNGAGLYTQSEAAFRVQRLRIERYRSAGILFFETQGTVEASDVLIRDGRGGVGLPNGRGMELYEHGRAKVERGLFLRASAHGIYVRGQQASAELYDVTVQQTQPGNEFGFAPGIYVSAGGVVNGARVDLYANHGHGVIMDAGRLALDDLLIRNTRPRAVDNGFGRGVELARGALFESQRLKIVNSHSIGLYAFDGNTRAVVTELAITGTSTSTCIAFSCNSGVSDGLVVALSASVEVDRFAIYDNGLYGVRFVNDQSRLILKNGRISGQGTGAQIVSGTYDLRNLAEGVLFQDNPRVFELLRPAD
jgi:hypothetical protein